MIVSAWILFIFFGFFTFLFMVSLFDKRVKKINMPVFTICVIMVALSAGVIWGGLFQ